MCRRQYSLTASISGHRRAGSVEDPDAAPVRVHRGRGRVSRRRGRPHLLYLLPGRCGRGCLAVTAGGAELDWRCLERPARPRAPRQREGGSQRQRSPCACAGEEPAGGGVRVPPRLRRSALRRSCTGHGLLGHCLADHRVDRNREFGAVLACVGRLLLQMRPGHRQPRAAGERGLPGQTLVKEAAERVDIGAAVERPAFDLFRRNVGRRADRAPLARPGRRARRIAGSGRSRRDTRARSHRAARWTA